MKLNYWTFSLSNVCIAFLFSFSFLSQNPPPSITDNKYSYDDSDIDVNVFIIAIDSFSSVWTNLALNEGIVKGKEDLKSHFDKTNVNLYVLDDSISTSSSYLRDWFEEDFIKIASNSINYLFLMSHGQLTAVTKDFQLVTSDTSSDPPKKSESLGGGEILDALLHLKDRKAIVFTFLDACNSGEFLELNDLDKYSLTQYCGIWSSTIGSQSSFEALLSQAIAKILKDNKDCVRIGDVVDLIEKEIKLLKNDNNFSHPIGTLVTFQEKGCLDSPFGKNNFVFLYNNYEYDVDYKLIEIGNARGSNNYAGILKKGGMKFINTDGLKFKLSVFHNQSFFHREAKIDLTVDKYMSYVTKVDNMTYVDSGMFDEFKARTVDRLGNDPNYVEKTLSKAIVLYSLTKSKNNYNELTTYFNSRFVTEPTYDANLWDNNILTRSYANNTDLASGTDSTTISLAVSIAFQNWYYNIDSTTRQKLTLETANAELLQDSLLIWLNAMDSSLIKEDRF